MEALHQGDYDTAFELLLRTLTFAQGATAREAALLLAEAYTLYGEGGLEGAYKALEESLAIDPEIAQDPLYQALYAELKALEGAPEADVRPLIPKSQEPRVRYHRAQALFYSGELEEALEALHEPLELPPYLAWRAWNLRGKILEQLGKSLEAAQAYAQGAQRAVGMERYWGLLDAAAMYVEAGAGEEALRALEDAQALIESEDPEDAATHFYLQARAHLLLGNPRLAMDAAQQALALEAEGAQPTHGPLLVQGQALLQLGQPREAIASFQEALRRAEGSDRSYVLHELGVAALEAGELPQAATYLRQAVQDPEYEYLGSAWGDLAEVLYRLSRPEEAQNAAEEAIQKGELHGGYLILGHLAYDRMHLDEAAEFYRKAAEAAPMGSPDWIAAEEMSIEALASLGYPNPPEIVQRIEALLPMIPPNDEWYRSLTSYLEKARSLIGKRSLN
jgi:tetratricopeptide (TPR) repeat protein